VEDAITTVIQHLEELGHVMDSLEVELHHQETDLEDLDQVLEEELVKQQLLEAVTVMEKLETEKLLTLREQLKTLDVVV
jgi:hypothetical protein